MNEQNGAALAVQNEVAPTLAIAFDLVEVERQVALRQQFIAAQMIEGRDFGVIPGLAAGAKPTLYKPGAEKLAAIYNLAPMVEVMQRVEDWDKPFLSYEVRVSLINKATGEISGQGIGSCNSREKAFKNMDAVGSANNILKRAKKRALVDAVLTTTGTSGIFEQWDESEDDPRPQRPAQRAQARQPRQQRADGAELPPMTHDQKVRIEELAPLLYTDGLAAVVRGSQGVPLALWGQARAAAVLERLESQYAARQQIQVGTPEDYGQFEGELAEAGIST